MSFAPDTDITVRALETLTFRAGFNTSVVVGGTALLGLAAGVVGVFALLRKHALMADALSHATLPGVACAFLFAGLAGLDGRSMAVLLPGAAVSGVLGVACVQGITRYSRLQQDAAIGIVLSVFFGAGVVGLSVIQSHAPSGSAGLYGLIYGQVATMRPRDVLLMGAIACVAVLVTLLLCKECALVCFNADFARVSGWWVGGLDAVMMGLIALVTVAGLQAVGVLMVIALLVIPPVTARLWTERLTTMLLVSGAIGALSGYLGASASALAPRQPAGALIVLAAGACFVLSLVAAPARGVVATGLRRLRLRVRIASDHLLERAHEAGSLGPGDIARLARRRGWSRVFRALVLLSLRQRGELAPSTGGLRVSARGRSRGARVARNHALWEQYLITHADIAPSHVDWSVDQVEHVLSDELVRELERQIDARKTPSGVADGTGRA